VTYDGLTHAIAVVVGIAFVIGAFTTTGIYDGMPPRGDKSLYPLTRTARVIVFIMGVVAILFGLTGWQG
jgi:hypothetical protein